MTLCWRRLALVSLLAALLWPFGTLAAAGSLPGPTASAIRESLFDAQQRIPTDPGSAAKAVAQAQADYAAILASKVSAADSGADQRVQTGFAALTTATARADAPAFAAARSQVWTAILAGGYAVTEQAIQSGDSATAQDWLAVREFRVVTRFSRPSANATLAVDGLARESVSGADALFAVRADLLDTYQARLTDALRTLATVDANGFSTRRAETAALAAGYFQILAPAYAQQRGADAQAAALAAFANLSATAVSGGDLGAGLQAINTDLRNFRAAPLSPAEQSRRAGQMLRFLSLVPVEYGRGVAGGQVTRALEVQEAITFHAGAYAAFADVQSLLDVQDHAKTAQADAQLAALGQALADAGTGAAVANPDAIQSQAQAISSLLSAYMPAAWQQGSTQGDFDVIGSMLDQMEAAARAGDYALAESARLEAYAVMETGPEARLTIFAPQLSTHLEGLFWYGDGGQSGLASLLQNGAALKDIQAARNQLDGSLSEAQNALGVASAPAAVAANAGLIVFREGLEAVLILASLLSSLKGTAERRHRQSMWVGTALALVATAFTWLLAHDVLQRLARYGEKLEAVVSLIAIAVLLLITNWFFHKTYWTGWVAGFHARKRQLLSGEASLWLGLAALGFTSVYREGFETVLFLQALSLESGSAVVLAGVGVALLAVVLIGLATFKLQVRLPHKRMLIVTGILIGGVLLQMVGNTVHILQLVGWLPIHLISGLTVPYWLGTWFGVYLTWEGLGLQAAAGVFVVGSYFLAEAARQKTKPGAESAGRGEKQLKPVG